MENVSTHPAPLRESASAAAIDQRARMAIFGAILLAMFLAALNLTVVGTALPRIGCRKPESLFRF
jgi:hypothetical protein